ncbi:MAG: hypothetical protein KatS3mg031_0335 [Chitinophagales bacterium]|nr:MAG: hypothetical protein KatS3mg031_0335 [Chitinophagales bacterium]
MKALKIILIILVILAAAWAVTSALLPSTARVERSAVIQAPAALIFNQVNTLKNWNQWSFWHKMDTTQQLTYTGPASGVGSSYSWDGPKTGKGTLTITESTPHEKILMELDFRPHGTAQVQWSFEPTDGGTRVTQSFQTQLGFTERIFPGLFFMDKFLGKAFETDLQNLKELCENMPPFQAEEVTTPLQWVLTLRDSCSVEDIPITLGSLYEKIVTFAMVSELPLKGYPIAIWHQFDPQADFVDVEAGIPLEDSISAPAGFHVVKIGGKAVKTIHRGDYESMSTTYNAFSNWMKDKGISSSGPPWEVYVTDPGEEKDTTKWITEIYFPI